MPVCASIKLRTVMSTIETDYVVKNNNPNGTYNVYFDIDNPDDFLIVRLYDASGEVIASKTVSRSLSNWSLDDVVIVGHS